MKEDDHGDMIPILRASYDTLDAKLKECFRYCALVPKNWPISEESLINIWMSNASIETDTCEEIVKALYNRCFLEETKKRNDNNEDDHRCFRMHDLAKEVAGEEMCVVDSDALTLEENVRHLNINSAIQTVERISRFQLKGKRLRTLLHHGIYTWRNPWEKLLGVDKMMSDFPVLRMLDLRNFRIDSLPDSVGKLIHLRYLNLSYNEFHSLPDSIAELWNLQSILLKSCNNLRELPVGIRKLINLRHLNLEGCNALMHMPYGMGALTCLRTLNVFVVGDSKSEHTAKLEDLEPLSKLQGDLIIKLPDKSSTLTDSSDGGAFLLRKAALRTLKIEWAESRYDTTSDQDILAKLQPHADLHDFTLYGYECLRLPPWGDDLASLLPNLVAMTIDSSRRCQHLPSFSKLECLKRLTVCNMSSLEYMEETMPGAVFFPTLEYFWLMGLPNLKGWCKELAARVDDESNEGQSSRLPSFPRLSELHIYGCPTLKMTSLPISSLGVYSLKGDEVDIFTIRAGEAFSGRFHTNDARLYVSTPWEQCLQGYPMSLKIMELNPFDVPSPSMDEAFRRMSKVLTTLEMKSIQGLKTIPRVLHHLTALRELHIVNCSEFTGEEDEENNQSQGFEGLEHLTLDDLPTLVRLPKEIQLTTSLQVLEIRQCKSLKRLSLDIRELINLRKLSLEMCDEWAETSIFAGLEHHSEHPSLSRFQWLKCLSLSFIPGLEYIQENDSTALSFPSLECVSLRNLPNLRDWCRGLATFPGLSSIGIYGCPNLDDNSMLFSSVTEYVYGIDCWPSTSSSMSSPCVRTNYMFLLKAALWEQHLRGNQVSLVINDYDNIEATIMKLDLGRVSSHLTTLKLQGCRSLKTLPKGLIHLTALQKLSIERCREFTCEEHEEDDETRWGGLKRLTHLEFANLPKMTRLDWIQLIDSLREVHVYGCNSLLVPEWAHAMFVYVTLPEQEGFRLVKKRVDMATLHLNDAEIPNLTRRKRQRKKGDTSA